MPRAKGRVSLSSKISAGRSALAGLRQSGALKLLFPRAQERLQAIIINTSGGITGGDRFALTADIAAGTHVGLTTQAAERAYGARSGETGHVRTAITLGDGASLHWLPQELILYDGCALERRLRIDLAETAALLMVEPVVFGRMAMGEVLTSGRFRDRIEINRDGLPLYRDGLYLHGDIAARLARPATAAGAAAMASALYVAPDAGARLTAVRAHLGETGGASLLHPDVLTVRVLAPDGYGLRQHLLPVLDLLSKSTLPPSWRL